MDKLNRFIGTHRERFSITENNVFAFSWSKVTRRLAFLDLIEARYDEASAAYVKTLFAAQKLTKPGTHPVSREQAALHMEALPIIADVQLQIEAFYLFAKIILDDVARALEYYFGPARRLSLDSHDDLAAKLERYSTEKGLSVSPEFVGAVADLKRRISDVRDYKFSHEKSPRTLSGTSWGGVGGARIMMTRLYPRGTDPEQFETEVLPDLRQSLDTYLGLAIDLIEANEMRTILKLDGK
jgi:hypothetical protein